jgi:hypothetical protein
MSNKRKVQLIAVVFLVLAIILFIPNTDWNKKNSVIGFISLIIGTTGSIISIFIPSNFSFLFDDGLWTHFNGGYQIIIFSKKHGMGKSPNVQIFQKDGEIYNEVGVAISHDSKGNVSIESNQSFVGKGIITS